VKFRQHLEEYIFLLLRLSIISACKEQQLTDLREHISALVPDVSETYTSFTLNSYWEHIVRSRHSFQVSLIETVLQFLNTKETTTVVDIGDSSGTHLRYMIAGNRDGHFNTLSINLDPAAIKKIRSYGLNAIQSRIEDMYEHPSFIRDPNIYLCFETLEHLRDPVTFLHDLASNTTCDYLILSVPYLRKSRVGLHQLRPQPGHIMTGADRPFNAEMTHIFELCPADWDLLFRFSGWKIVRSVRFTAYPKKNILTLTRFLWRRLNFDGHYGIILQPDNSIASQYLDW
jgi:hypothetical protein